MYVLSVFFGSMVRDFFEGITATSSLKPQLESSPHTQRCPGRQDFSGTFYPEGQLQKGIEGWGKPIKVKHR